MSDHLSDALDRIWADGYAAGRRRSDLEALGVGLILGAIVILALAWASEACAQTPPQASVRYKRVLTMIAQQEFGLSAPIAALAGQIEAESGWNPHARSPVGARGLTQFMPATAAALAQRHPVLAGEALFNPVWSMRAQAIYMRELIEQVQARDACESYAFALSAYNGGLRWVYKRQQLSDEPDVCLGSTCDINPGITSSNQLENSAYPRKILLRLEPIYAAAWSSPRLCR